MKRIFDAKIRKVGNSYVITIPKDTIDRFEIKEGDFVGVSLDSKDLKHRKEKLEGKNEKL
jgi:putative addiction module antidote